MRLITATVLALLAASSCWATREDLQKIAPEKINSWSAVKDATVYGRGDGITDIYNGGYEVYTKAGVTEALRRIYQQKGKYVEVTAHQMKSASAARAFLADRYRMETGKSAPKAQSFLRFSSSGSGSSTAYAVQGRWFFTAVVFEETAQGRAQAEGFVKVLEQKSAALDKSRQKQGGKG